MQFQYEYAGDIYSVRLKKQADGSYIATIGADAYHITATALSAGTWLIDSNGERVTVHTAKDKEKRYLQVAGTQFELEKSSGRRRASRRAGAVGDLKAEMPGQVLDVRVENGDHVEAGQVLLVLEAMKMEIRVTAPYAGRINKLSVVAGDVVERGYVLVEVVNDAD